MNLFQRLRRSTVIVLILSPTGLLFIAITRLLVISNYDTTTASAIVSSGGYTNTLLGSVIPLIPIFLPYFSLVLFYFKRPVGGTLTLAASVLISPVAMNRHATSGLWQEIERSTFKWPSVHLFIFAPLTIIATITCLLTLALGFGAFARTVGVIASLALLPFVAQAYQLPHGNNFYKQELRRPWLPSETITLTSGQKFVGYVLPGNDNWLVVLREDTRRIIYYPSSEVANREVCELGAPGTARPLVALSAKSALTPPCASAS